MISLAIERGWIRSVFGWTYRTEGEPDRKKLLRSLANFPMQSGGAEIIRLAACYATEQGITVCATVHDALLVVTPEVLCAIRTLPPGHPFDTVFDPTGLTVRSFPVLIDRGNEVARQYRLVHGFPPDLIALYQQFGIDLTEHNGDDSWTLPLPATFVIDQHAIIRSADVRVDYRNRAEPAQTIALLKQLGARP